MDKKETQILSKTQKAKLQKVEIEFNLLCFFKRCNNTFRELYISHKQPTLQKPNSQNLLSATEAEKTANKINTDSPFQSLLSIFR